MVAVNKLTANFQRFFVRLNPSPTYEAAASSAYNNIKALLEAAQGPAGELGIQCFLQGSYRRDTAIHTINDVDFVAVCTSLTHGGPTYEGARSWSRDDIFATIAASIRQNHHYKDKVRYRDQSLCLKVVLEGVKVEILPAVLKHGSTYSDEPFRIYRPESGLWEDAFARQHQWLVSRKNERSSGMYVPMIKVLKHLRSTWRGFNPDDAVSFHLECLLYQLPDQVFSGSTADVIEKVLTHLASFGVLHAVGSGLRSPCGDKVLFSDSEWSSTAYARFHRAVAEWAALARTANQAADPDDAITEWKRLLGDTYFPRQVS